ncbi:hypothetical protein [Synechococcus sp. 1G10]|uniref:hypothetical protein n=1 Tax=Synechococcus sp. 1G10 TaxID=2025605 RepID=UPI0013034354|nr:hypothetical protein [Synechococcus sp. 1G10]
MPESQPHPQSRTQLTHPLQEPPQPGSTSPRRREEPGASAQRKRYLASLDATDPES